MLAYTYLNGFRRCHSMINRVINLGEPLEIMYYNYYFTHLDPLSNKSIHIGSIMFDITRIRLYDRANPTIHYWLNHPRGSHFQIELVAVASLQKPLIAFRYFIYIVVETLHTCTTNNFSCRCIAINNK